MCRLPTPLQRQRDCFINIFPFYSIIVFVILYQIQSPVADTCRSTIACMAYRLSTNQRLPRRFHLPSIALHLRHLTQGSLKTHCIVLAVMTYCGFVAP